MPHVQAEGFAHVWFNKTTGYVLPVFYWKNMKQFIVFSAVINLQMWYKKYIQSIQPVA